MTNVRPRLGSMRRGPLGRWRPSPERPDAALSKPLLGCCRALQLLGAKLEPPSNEQDLRGIVGRERRRARCWGSVHGLDRLVDLPTCARGRRVRELAAKASPTDEIQAAITPESRHAVQKRETLHTVSKRREMLLEGFEASHPVPDPRGVLEVESAYGAFYPALE